MLPDDKRRNHIRSGCTGCPKCQHQKPRRGSGIPAISYSAASRELEWENFRAEVQKELADTAAKKPKPKKTKKKATTVDMDAMWMQPIGEKSKWIYYTDEHGKKRRRPRHRSHPNPPRSEYEVRAGGPGFAKQPEIATALKDMADWLGISLSASIGGLPSVDEALKTRSKGTQAFKDADKLLSEFADIVIYVSGTDWPTHQPELGGKPFGYTVPYSVPEGEAEYSRRATLFLNKNYYMYGGEAAYLGTVHELGHAFGATMRKRSFEEPFTMDTPQNTEFDLEREHQIKPTSAHCTVQYPQSERACIMTADPRYYGPSNGNPRELVRIHKEQGTWKSLDMFCPKCQEYLFKKDHRIDLKPNPPKKAGLFTGGRHTGGGTYLRAHDQVLAQHPTKGSIEVDVMMKPLLEALWARGIETGYSCSGGNLEPYPFDADEARKKGLNAIPMGEYALEEKWKAHQSQKGDLGVEGDIDNKPGYILFSNVYSGELDIPAEFISHRQGGPRTIGWDAAEDYANLRRLYAAFEVDFAHPNPPVEVQPRRVSPTKEGRFVCEGEDVTNRYAVTPVISVDGKTSQLSVMDFDGDNFIDSDLKPQGNLVRVNMFRRKAGFKVIKNGKPIKTQPDYIISVETGGKHYYASSEVSMEWAKLASFPSKKSEPRLRLETRGILVKSAGKGRVSIRGKMHPLFDKIKIIPKVETNPVQDPGFHTQFGRHEIGTLLGPHGHVIDGGKSSSRGGGREIIVVDRKQYPSKFLDDLYQEFIQYPDVKNRWPIASEELINLDRFPKPEWTTGDQDPYQPSHPLHNKTWTIDEINNMGGVCRHLGILNAAIFERAIKEGIVNGKVYYVRGRGHGWCQIQSTRSGKMYVLDAAQKNWGEINDLDVDPRRDKRTGEMVRGGYQGRKDPPLYFKYGDASFPKNNPPPPDFTHDLGTGFTRDEIMTSALAPKLLDQIKQIATEQNSTRYIKVKLKGKKYTILITEQPPEQGETLLAVIRPGHDIEWQQRMNPPPPATIQWGFQAIPKKPRQGHGRLYTGGGKWRQVNLEKALQGELVTAEQSKRYKNTYSPYRSKHFSPLPAEARAWKTSTFKSHESDYEHWVNSLDTDEAPYIATMKIDGEGNMAHFTGEETVLWNWYDKWRTGFAVTDEITQMLKSKKVKSAKLMGELYAVSRAGLMLPLTGGEITEDGSKESTMSFLKKPETLERQERMRLAVFDILELNGKDLRDVPYDERIAIAAGLVGGGKAVRAIPMATGTGLSPLQKIWGEGMLEPEFEGLVLRFKEPSAAQPSKKHRSYKVKGAATADLAVIGFYRGGIKRPGHKGTLAGAMGGLALAFMDEDGNYIYSGNIGTGWSHKERYDIVEELLPHTAKLVGDKVKWGDHHVMTTEYEKMLRLPTGSLLEALKTVMADEGKKEAVYEALQKEWGVTGDEVDARWNLIQEVYADPEEAIEFEQVAKIILQSHDDRGRGVMIPVKPTKILEAEYRGLNWNDRPVYRLKGKTYEQVGTTRAPALFQPSFKRWRDDKSFTTHDLRLEQVPPEGAGKWDVNPPEEIILFPDFTPPEGMMRDNPNSWGYSPWNSGPYGPGPFGKPPNRPHMQTGRDDPQPEEAEENPRVAAWWGPKENPKSYAGSGKPIEQKAHKGRTHHRLGGKTNWWLALVAYETSKHAAEDTEDFTKKCMDNLESIHGPVKTHQSQRYLICTKEGVELGPVHSETGGPDISTESVQNRSWDEPATLYETDHILGTKTKLNPPPNRAVLINEGGRIIDITHPPQPRGFQRAMEDLAKRNPPPEGMTIHMYTLKIPFKPEDAMVASDALEAKGYRFISEDLTSMIFTLEVPYAKKKTIGSMPRISFQQNRADALLFSAHKLTKNQQRRVGRDLKSAANKQNPPDALDSMGIDKLRREFFRRRKAGEEEYQARIDPEVFNFESKLRKFLKDNESTKAPEPKKGKKGKKDEKPEATDVRAHKRAKPKSKAKPKRVKSVSTPISRLIMGSLLIRRDWKSKAQIALEKKEAEAKKKEAAAKKKEAEAKKKEAKKGKGKGKGKAKGKENPPRNNPYAEEYIEDHKPMPESKVNKTFKSEKIRGPIGSKELFEQMTEKIQTFGEAFGWIRDGNLYYKEGPQTLNEARIDGKMMEGADAFFHTHPKAWEPSQTSSDDFIVYHGLFTNLGICHHFTVMGDRVDWFRFYKSDKIPTEEMSEVAEDFEKEISEVFDKAEEKFLETIDNQHAHLSARTRHINNELARCIPEYKARFKCYTLSPTQIRKASNGKSN